MIYANIDIFSVLYLRLLVNNPVQCLSNLLAQVQRSVIEVIKKAIMRLSSALVLALPVLVLMIDCTLGQWTPKNKFAFYDRSQRANGDCGYDSCPATREGRTHLFLNIINVSSCLPKKE